MSTLLDTNVLSELLRTTPEPKVLAWFSMQPADTLFVSAVTQAEMMLGARLLPAGRRRTALEAALRATFDEDFGTRILPFDSAAVSTYVDIVSVRRAAGRPISQFDAQIAAIARHHGARLATRNVGDFEGAGVAIVNPWTSAPRK
ncbi:type II toxin-antitoxin system VapC family toxin [Variovorax saccharolyticus]|uniref:type II toxin-antitoxin system VapC family toxin n=1 Tax=Variovorax saccharolyticus TaxID=3053516 RepID=UPI002578646F|nr:MULTISPECIES: type II toxin-antitoxin system VapC family toxin [unclassified Variovorax]MDM0017165.1 type II toxin-antitoxin system VapC family toxin [Variovorax sp. J22R187]MDM0029285.1 type II toxin-antitoxin system VapC family toxin [Variovorax sp. J31P216]